MTRTDNLDGTFSWPPMTDTTGAQPDGNERGSHPPFVVPLTPEGSNLYDCRLSLLPPKPSHRKEEVMRPASAPATTSTNRLVVSHLAIGASSVGVSRQEDAESPSSALARSHPDTEAW